MQQKGRKFFHVYRISIIYWNLYVDLERKWLCQLYLSEFAHNDVFYGSYLFVGKAPCVPKNKKQFLCAVDQPVQLFYSADPLGRTSFCGQTETACQCARRWHCRRLYCDDGTDSFYLSNRCNDPWQYAAEMAPETFYKKAETEIKIQGMNLSIDS